MGLKFKFKIKVEMVWLDDLMQMPILYSRILPPDIPQGSSDIFRLCQIHITHPQLCDEHMTWQAADMAWAWLGHGSSLPHCRSVFVLPFSRSPWPKFRPRWLNWPQRHRVDTVRERNQKEIRKIQKESTKPKKEAHHVTVIKLYHIISIHIHKN